MKTLSHKGVEYSEVSLSELGQEMRFDADYWEPSYLRNEEIIKSKKHSLTKAFAPNPQYGISVAMNEEGVGYSILKMDNIMEMLAEDNDAKFADVSAKTFNQFKLKKFDVLFNRVNSDEFVGRTGIYLMDGEHTFASYLVRVDSGKSHTNCYLTSYLNSKYGKTALQRVKRRAVNQANINAKELSNLNIPLPSETLQKEIQTLLVNAQKQKINSESLFWEAEHILLSELGLDAWKPSAKKFKYHGVTFEVDDTANSISFNEFIKADRLDAEYWHPKYADFATMLMKNKSIKFSQLGDLVTPMKGIEIGSQEYLEEGNYPFIRVSNITRQGFDFTTTKYVKPETFKKLKDYQVQKGEILLSKDGTAGIAYLIREEITGINSSAILRLANISKLPSAYIELVLNSPIVQIQIERKMSGALIQHLKVTEAMKFIIPEIPSTKKVANKVETAFEKKNLGKSCLNTAVKAVEIFIEKDEKDALKFIQQNTK
jgi:type I restriction enzyme, S subunit